MLASSTAPSPIDPPSRVPWLFIVAGTVLRVIWPLDFEWKHDEKWMFSMAQRIAHGDEPWPWVGMPSGAAGIANPGASVWPFAVLARVARDPPSMTLAIEILNGFALWGFALWVHKTWSDRDRALGLWGVALFAVSPLPVLYARKIWAQDLLPVFLVPWLWSHTRRARAGAAFGWGFLGALLGQVHMSGFFAAAGQLIATWLFDRKRTHWKAWFAGSALAALPLLPWLMFLYSPHNVHSELPRVLSLRFFLYAFLTGWGLSLQYSLLKHYADFLRGPELFGVHTFLVGAAHVALGLLAVGCAVLALRHWRLLIGLSPALRVYAFTIFLAGVMMIALGLPIHPHYMIIFSPLLHVMAATLLRLRPRWSLIAASLQLFLTVSFMWFIHVQGGAQRGDYGISYRAQTPLQRALPPGQP